MQATVCVATSTSMLHCEQLHMHNSLSLVRTEWAPISKKWTSSNMGTQSFGDGTICISLVNWGWGPHKCLVVGGEPPYAPHTKVGQWYTNYSTGFQPYICSPKLQYLEPWHQTGVPHFPALSSVLAIKAFVLLITFMYTHAYFNVCMTIQYMWLANSNAILLLVL